MRRKKSRRRKLRLGAVALALILSMTAAVPLFAMDDDEYDGYKADTLAIYVGYYGGEFYEKKVFTESELRSLGVVNADYTYIDTMPSVVIDHVQGVKLSDIIEAAGIDLNSVQKFEFWTNDKKGGKFTEFTKASLIDTPRYCFYSLPDNYDTDTGTIAPEASMTKEPVETVMALADDWTRCISGATFGSDYLNLNTNTRYRLIYGQRTADEQAANRSAKWVNKICVQLGGSPTLTLKDANLEGEVGSVLRTEAVYTGDSAVLDGTGITWSSSDESVATVDQNGNITIKGEGTATITASGGGMTATTTVNGSAKEEDDDDKSGNTAGTGTSGNGTGSGSSSDSQSGGTPDSKKSDLKSTDSPGKLFELSSTEVGSQSDTGGVQNWRAYEMSETAQELANVDEDNPLAPFTGAAAAILFVTSGAAYAASFYRNIGRKKNVYKRKSE